MTKKEIEKFLKKTNAKKIKNGYLLTMEASMCLEKESLKDISKEGLKAILLEMFGSAIKDEIKDLFN